MSYNSSNPRFYIIVSLPTPTLPVMSDFLKISPNVSNLLTGTGSVGMEAVSPGRRNKIIKMLTEFNQQTEMSNGSSEVKEKSQSKNIAQTFFIVTTLEFFRKRIIINSNH